MASARRPLPSQAASTQLNLFRKAVSIMKKITTPLIGLVLLGVGSAGVLAGPDPGWQVVKDRKGKCTISVPSDWKSDGLSLASPDGSVDAVVSGNINFTALADVKPTIQSMLVPTKTFQDSAARLWYQYTAAGTATRWYVGVPIPGGGVCGAQISYKRAADEAVAKKIAMSVAPAK
jgi:hypothetical protein